MGKAVHAALADLFAFVVEERFVEALEEAAVQEWDETEERFDFLRAGEERLVAPDGGVEVLGAFVVLAFADEMALRLAVGVHLRVECGEEQVLQDAGVVGGGVG